MLEELLIPDLKLAVSEGDWESVSELASILHPSVFCDTLSEYDFEIVWSAFSVLSPEIRPLIFEYLSPEFQDELVMRLPKPEVAVLIERMSHDDRAQLVRRMDDERTAVIMPLVAHADREDIKKLLSYEEGTVGSIMTTDYASIPADCTVGDALNRLRREAPNRETIYYIYVIDDQRRLIGFLSLKALILALPSKTAGDVMREDVMFVAVDMDVREAASRLAQYDLLALPVVDSEHKLVGIITHDDIIDVIQETATEDIHRMGAVLPLEGEYIESPFWKTVGNRAVWLFLLFGAEMCTSLVLDSYESLFQTFVVLVVFMPVITATGGNSGSQAASLITRSLALGEVEPSDWLRVGIRELFSGIVLGLAVGGLGAAVVFLFFPHKALLALILVFSLVTVTTAGSLIGSLMPLFFKKVGLDPAISSGPFVSSLVDVLGIFMYCSIAAFLVVRMN